MVQTFDTSRVGGGTYELEQDANGNYKLKSVDFAQVNKLNLPDLKTSDVTTPPVATIPKQPDVADPFKKLGTQNTGGGEGVGQDYSDVMLKTPEVKDVSVRDAGDAMTKDAQSTRQNFDQSVEDMQTAAEQNYNKALKDFQAAKGGSPAILSDARANVANARQQVDQAFGFMDQAATTPYQDAITRGQVGVKAGSITPERATGLQKVKSKASDAVGKVKDSSLIQEISKFSPLRIAGNVLGALLDGILPEETNVQQLNKSYFNTREDGRIAGNPATDLYAGMNRNSAFGNLETAGAKRIATREATIAKREKTNKPMSDKFKADTEKMKEQQKDYQKEKAAKQKATQGPAGGATTGGGGGGSDSGRVICTDLHRTGELSTRDWIRDTKFTFKTLSIKHVKGYLLWAEPTVKHIQKYPRYRKVWKHIAQHRANDIAWRLNEGKFDLLGRIYSYIGEPVCWMLGNFVSDKQISKYNLTHWRRA
jgi:hypothetical protein